MIEFILKLKGPKTFDELKDSYESFASYAIRNALKRLIEKNKIKKKKYIAEEAS